MLGIDVGGDAALLLRFRHRVQRQGRLAGRFGPIDLDDPAARQPADAERDIQSQGTGGNRVGLGHRLAASQLHHRALAEGPVDLGERRVQRALPLRRFLLADNPQKCLFHHRSPPYFTAAPESQEKPPGCNCACFVLECKRRSSYCFFKVIWNSSANVPKNRHRHGGIVYMTQQASYDSPGQADARKFQTEITPGDDRDRGGRLARDSR